MILSTTEMIKWLVDNGISLGKIRDEFSQNGPEILASLAAEISGVACCDFNMLDHQYTLTLEEEPITNREFLEALSIDEYHEWLDSTYSGPKMTVS